jgi:arylsulfatase A-like enzyme
VHGFAEVSPTDQTTQTLRAVYLGLASEVDHHIGRVLRFLKDNGQYDDTLIVITADHGEMLGDHHAWGKMSVYDAAYHTPLVIRAPGNARNAGLRVDVPTESIDIAPTILDSVGQAIPNSMDGRSLPWQGRGRERRAQARIRVGPCAVDAPNAAPPDAQHGPYTLVAFDHAGWAEIGAALFLTCAGPAPCDIADVAFSGFIDKPG